MVVNGARQVGKTYSVLAFARQNFKRVLHIDFSAQPLYCALFESDITPAALLPQIEALSRTTVDPADTLLFFDEVQACPRALTSLKYFCEQAPEYPVIAAGSLLGVALARKDYSFPVGKVDLLHLYPLDFEEFLWAMGEEALVRLIRDCFSRDAPLNLHEHALDWYRKYVLVGGLPEAVQAYALSQAFPQIRGIQDALTDAYLADMTKYASPIDSAKILNVWRSVPEQLAKENHKFQYATIASSARAHQYEAAINWLQAAGLVMYCYRVDAGVRPLKAHVERDFFKLYLFDVGLLSALPGRFGGRPASGVGQECVFARGHCGKLRDAAVAGGGHVRVLLGNDKQVGSGLRRAEGERRDSHRGEVGRQRVVAQPGSLSQGIPASLRDASLHQELRARRGRQERPSVRGVLHRIEKCYLQNRIVLS